MLEITNVKREGVKEYLLFKNQRKREGSQLWERVEQGVEAPDVRSPTLSCAAPRGGGCCTKALVLGVCFGLGQGTAELSSGHAVCFRRVSREK